MEKEALGLILAVRTFSVYFGTAPIRVYTDHSLLQFLRRMSTHNQKLFALELGAGPVQSGCQASAGEGERPSGPP